MRPICTTLAAMTAFLILPTVWADQSPDPRDYGAVPVDEVPSKEDMEAVERLLQGKASAETPVNRLMAARSLKCTFGPGSEASWQDGAPVPKSSRFDATLFFDAIDKAAGQARIIGNQGAEDVLVVAHYGITFLEQTGFGNLSFTTIFPIYSQEEEGRFTAVTSRHTAGPEPFGALPSQYYGSCEVWGQ